MDPQSVGKIYSCQVRNSGIVMLDVYSGETFWIWSTSFLCHRNEEILLHLPNLPSSAKFNRKLPCNTFPSVLFSTGYWPLYVLSAMLRNRLGLSLNVAKRAAVHWVWEIWAQRDCSTKHLLDIRKFWNSLFFLFCKIGANQLYTFRNEKWWISPKRYNCIFTSKHFTVTPFNCRESHLASCFFVKA